MEVCSVLDGSQTIESAFWIDILSTAMPRFRNRESRVDSLKGLRTSTVKRSKASYSLGSVGLSVISKLWCVMPSGFDVS